MYRFLLYRAIGLLFVLLSVTFITFIFGYWGAHVGTGDPIKSMMGTHFDQQSYLRLQHEYGLDLPWWQQYFNFVGNLLHGTFGLSFNYPERQAWDVVKGALPYSAELGLEILALTLVIGIPAGIIGALRANTHVDTGITTTFITFYALPDIALILFFQVLMVSLYQHHLPSLPIAGWNTWQSRIAPVLITATTGAGYFTRLTRTTVLEVLGQDYVRTARAKGLVESVVIARHALRNAILPLLSAIGPSLAFIVTGVFITEQFFNIPGISNVTLDAISQRDYPIIQATTFLICITVVVANALTDVAYAIVDPRISIE